MRIPIATYRLQLSQSFTLSDALLIVPYLQKLGISDLYLSPLFQAEEGSDHGYDIVDFSKINKEIGQESDLKALAKELKAQGMGLILDIVPNHMSIASSSNKWWQDVLLRGEKSIFACYFDIDWDSPKKDLKRKVLQPFLDKPLQKLLEKKQFSLIQEGKKHYIAFGKKRYPLCKVCKDISQTLDAQHYLLSDWKMGITDLNYRRFFEVSELAALRQECDFVFRDTHKKLFEWIDKGWVTGIRVDHLDGLTNPRKYLFDLRKRYPDLFILCEKILHPQEKLRENFPIQGTTGYDALNHINALFIKENLEQEYFRFIKKEVSWEETALESKGYFLKNTMQPELSRLKRFIPKKLHQALFHFLIAFTVYRSYAENNCLSKEDQNLLFKALEKAKTLSLNEPWKEFAKELLWNRPFLLALQQVTAPLAAKGIEDTAFYRYFPLGSLNEVGGPLFEKERTIDSFHRWAFSRQKRWPYSFNALTTHDTKRSEDVRARLNALSELPKLWESFLKQAQEMNALFKISGFPDVNEEYLLYQTLVGTFDGKNVDRKYKEKIASYMVKAAKEAKLYTSWIAPNKLYEQALKHFTFEILSKRHGFTKLLQDFVKKLLLASYKNTLSQTLLKVTIPGIPDFYQGSEIPLYTLVDPDNRNPVDYSSLRKSLHIDEKQTLIASALLFRKCHRELFEKGAYVPIKSLGAHAEKVVAFYRKTNTNTVLVAIERYFTDPFVKSTWVLVEPGKYRDAFTKEEFFLKEKSSVKKVFRGHSYALLEKLF